MKNDLGKIFSIVFLPACIAVLSQCGGGGGGGPDDSVDPIVTPDPNSDLASQAVNTFDDSGIDITLKSEDGNGYHDFEETEQYKKETTTLTLTNGTSEDTTFFISFYGSGGGFRFVEEIEGEETVFASVSDLVLAAGTSKDYTLQFDASLMGTRSGYIEVTVSGLSGYIHFPFQGAVTGPADFKVILASYMCSDDDAPDLSTLDFMRVPSGRAATQSLKICNTGGDRLNINTVQFEASASGAESSAMEVDDEVDDIDLDGFEDLITDTLNPDYFKYYPPPWDEEFLEPKLEDYTGALPDGPSAFSVTENSTGRSPDGMAIESGGYVRLDVVFEPTLMIEAPEGSLYNPISYAAKMTINTSLGEVDVDAVGATGGKEPVLEVTYTTDPADPCLDDDETSCSMELDLDSFDSAINFGTVSVFSDWIPEDSQAVILKLHNDGSGLTYHSNLKIWADPITAGYFTFVKKEDLVREDLWRSSEEVSFPLDVAVGQSVFLEIHYSPTPPACDEATEESCPWDFYDMGWLVLKHTGANGPENGVVLVGQQELSNAVLVYQDDTKLKSDNAITPYSDSNRKNLCNFLIDENTDADGDGAVDGNTTKKFTIENNSTNYTLTSTITAGSLYNAEDESVVGSFTVDNSSVPTSFGAPSEFTATFFVDDTVAAGTEIHGLLTIVNSYGTADLDSDHPADYSIYFKGVAATTGECTGSGTPVDGSAVLLIDRITMILDGLETARNPPSFKLHIPAKVYKDHGAIMLGAVEYDPINTDPNSVKVFKPYNHQMANVNGCFPLPTNPYRQEAKEGSWDDPDTQCPFDNGTIAFTGAEACIPANKPEVYTDGTNTYYVFYHEFVKFEPGNCNNVEMEGKIATFYLKEGQTVKEVFDAMESEVGIDKSAAEYQDFLKTFQFDSYITFNTAYSSGACNHAAGETISGTTDAEAIRDCWDAFVGDENLWRSKGLIEECTYFLFSVDAGCVPSDVDWKDDVDPEDLCDDVSITINRPDTWTGFGEYEPHVDLDTGEESETRWDFNVRNVHLVGSFIVNSLGPFFDNTAKLLFADLYATMTTKAIGAEDPWDDLIAVNNRSDFDKEDIYLDIGDSTTEFNWTADGINSEFTTGTGAEDDRDCYDESGKPLTLTSCRGNFVIREDGNTIMPAGEPVNLENLNQLLIVGLSSFHGKKGLSPSFAQEGSDGKGKPLVFTLHGCLKGLEEGEELSEDAGCQDEHWDDEDVVAQYCSDNYGILSDEECAISRSTDWDGTGDTPRHWINYTIFDQDRNRLTDYFDYPNNYFLTEDLIIKACGAGM
ncbi:MAG: hypothetical protein HYU99_07475 [Deltaproteobacteria bacterium]|nr:hypothetical protein [Deltaproteobacteria bacterium]